MEFNEIREYLMENGSAERAEKMKTVAPGAKKIYGNTMPQLNELAKLIKDGGFELVEALWKGGAYEEKMLAAKLLHHLCKKDPVKAIALVKKYGAGIDNWAVCDTLGMQSLKPINKKYGKEIFALAEELASSANMWERRLSMVLLEDFTKQPALHPRILQMVNKHRSDTEYYIKKAVKWLDAALDKHR